MSFIARRQPAYHREPFMRGRNQHIFCKDIYFFFEKCFDLSPNYSIFAVSKGLKIPIIRYSLTVRERMTML